jgi:acetyl-CoA carboxylase carboxyltransferase component
MAFCRDCGGSGWCSEYHFVEVSVEDPDNVRGIVAEYREKFASLILRVGYIDDVIEPWETRPRLINSLEMLSNKRDSNPPKKHGCIPL